MSIIPDAGEDNRAIVKARLYEDRDVEVVVRGHRHRLIEGGQESVASYCNKCGGEHAARGYCCGCGAPAATVIAKAE